MSRPSFFERFHRGHLNRWEHALVGGVTGVGFCLFLTLAIVMTSSVHRSPDALSIPVFILYMGSVCGALGLVMGAMAEVSPYAYAYQNNGPQPKIVAFVWPQEHATRRSLKALGRALKQWQKRHPSVKSIEGMGRLLNGYYPRPDSMRPYVEDGIRGEEIHWPHQTPEGVVFEYHKMRVVDPWLHCPARVFATDDMTSLEAVKSLLNAIPPDLVRVIGFAREA